ncbi:MAG: AAA family ATPase [Chloroflexi bacterium]|nr:AAA family ATPase [Chloroflexota bacterium]
MRLEITDDLDALLGVIPPDLAEQVRAQGEFDKLLEVVLDLGRLPEARYLEREAVLRQTEVTEQDLEYVVARIGEFGDDNRAGIPRTLHRTSAIRNRRSKIVGLSLRVGRAVYGTVDIIHDLVESGKSILLLGRPGVGKTTMLREVARILGEKKRVVIVDTSNEIGGDGDIPHPAIGRARRMQVKTPLLQHEVMIEAVENHMPEVIVIDEIGRELEAAAARTIAERGVQLVGTAHGNTLENIMLNPTLADLVGGIQAVTLSDEEARRRGTQKTVLERRAPPTFDVVVEIQDREHLAVHHDVAEAVDAILRGRSLPAEVRYRDEKGEVRTERALLPREELTPEMASTLGARRGAAMPLRTVRVYPYGINQSSLVQAARGMGLPVEIAEELGQADVVFTLRSYYRRRPPSIVEAERGGVPVYVLRNNTLRQMESSLADVFGVQVRVDPFASALEETRVAIERVLAGARSVELSPQNAFIRRQQHELAKRAQLQSRSKGKEPRRRVQIFKDQAFAEEGE